MTRVLMVLAISVSFMALGNPSAVAGTGQAEDPTALQRIDVNIHNYNLCGAACRPGAHPTANATNAINLARYFFVADDAEALLLQEICLAQLDDLVAGLSGGWSWVFVAARQETPTCDADTEGRTWYGNAILHRGSFTDYDGWRLSNPGRDCTTPTVECRVMVCAFVDGSAAGSYGNCNTHLTHNSTSVAQQQANEYLWNATVYLGGVPRWIGGDFNLSPSELPGGYQAPWRQLVLGNTIPAPTPNRQIDYIWARGMTGYGLRNIDCSFQTQHSDHCYTAGSAWWAT
jgi:endonuclease/exonuclease/phosphatase family metal-dependent hydrolase